MGFKEELKQKELAKDFGFPVFERVPFDDGYELSIQISTDAEEPTLEDCEEWDLAVYKDDRIITPYDNYGEFLIRFKKHWSINESYALQITVDEVQEIFSFFSSMFGGLANWESTLGEFEF